jgi:hypothetical protein
MGNGESLRKAKRKDFSYEIKVRFTRQDHYTSVMVKDISASGLRLIVTRLVKKGDLLELKMCINGRDIQCQGKVAWVLLLRPSFGDVPSFDLGLEFCGMNAQDKEFFDKLTGE